MGSDQHTPADERADGAWDQAQVRGTVPTDDSVSATVVADAPGAARWDIGNADTDWYVGEASLTFVDIGASGEGEPSAQIALYARPADVGTITFGTSIELTVADARALAARLTAWADGTEPAPCDVCGRTGCEACPIEVLEAAQRDGAL